MKTKKKQKIFFQHLRFKKMSKFKKKYKKLKFIFEIKNYLKFHSQILIFYYFFFQFFLIFLNTRSEKK